MMKYITMQKKGNLVRVYVYKFKINKQETLLAYEWHPKTENLISLGVHEIFFKNLKN
jgi:mRNA interferase RelE/StbE